MQTKIRTDPISHFNPPRLLEVRYKGLVVEIYSNRREHTLKNTIHQQHYQTAFSRQQTRQH